MCPSSTSPVPLSAWSCLMIECYQSGQRCWVGGAQPSSAGKAEVWDNCTETMQGANGTWSSGFEETQPLHAGHTGPATNHSSSRGAGLRLACETFCSIKVHCFVSTEAHECQDAISSVGPSSGEECRGTWCSLLPAAGVEDSGPSPSHRASMGQPAFAPAHAEPVSLPHHGLPLGAAES